MGAPDFDAPLDFGSSFLLDRGTVEDEGLKVEAKIFDNQPRYHGNRPMSRGGGKKTWHQRQKAKDERKGIKKKKKKPDQIVTTQIIDHIQMDQFCTRDLFSREFSRV